jgi:hypothetical protein
VAIAGYKKTRFLKETWFLRVVTLFRIDDVDINEPNKEIDVNLGVKL